MLATTEHASRSSLTDYYENVRGLLAKLPLQGSLPVAARPTARLTHTWRPPRLRAIIRATIGATRIILPFNFDLETGVRMT